MRLAGKSVLITGAKGGLGSYVTKLFLAEGAQVTGVSRSIAPQDFPGGDFHALPASLSSRANAEALVASVLAQRSRIDAVIHLVGAFEAGPALPQTPDEAFARMLDANFYSALHVIRAVLPTMRAQGWGLVAAIGSLAALNAAPGQAAYAASKAALVSLLRSVAIENQDRHLRAHVLLPGTLDLPANRLAQPDADRSQWTSPNDIAGLLVDLTLGSDERKPVVLPLAQQELT
jgi:NAD(P)-dependent dehydrogenase (short-subunit alcohol dehydrogenase family)